MPGLLAGRHGEVLSSTCVSGGSPKSLNDMALVELRHPGATLSLYERQGGKMVTLSATCVDVSGSVGILEDRQKNRRRRSGSDAHRRLSADDVRSAAELVRPALV